VINRRLRSEIGENPLLKSERHMLAGSICASRRQQFLSEFFRVHTSAMVSDGA
jgi:hypothetical protein